ncbi:MAG: DUF885 domain-containing protein [Thermoplasmata archaeon]
MTDAALDALAKEFFDWYCEWNPPFATYVGIHTWDHLLPKGSAAAVVKETRVVKDYLARLEAIDRKSLSPGKRIDYGVLRNAGRLWVFQNEELRIWESKPAAPEDVAESLFLLFMRDFAPLPKRLESIAGRLERSPRFIEDSKDRIRKPTKVWVEIGLEGAASTPAFLDVITAAGKETLPAADFDHLVETIAKTKESIAVYEAWVRSDVLPRAQDRVGIGATKFRKLVRLRELGLTVDEIYAIGKKYLRNSKRELARLAGEIKKDARVDEAQAIVKGDHAKTWDEALTYTAKAMDESKRFILEHAFATIPAKEELRVIFTPAFLRHIIPFAAYSPPGKFDGTGLGFYMVTPHEDRPEMLREAYYAGIRNTAVHEGYPGHHLQLACANLNPSYARQLSTAVESIEGWAHYCEQMMKEQGFGADPATRVAQMLDQIWRACRILIDVDLHCGRMTFDEAVDFLVKEAGMERPGAVAEMKRYSFTPAYPLSYLVGKHLILTLRKEVRKGLGKQYSEKLFHDTYLYAGSIPMTYMRQIFAYKVKELQKLRKKGL